MPTTQPTTPPTGVCSRCGAAAAPGARFCAACGAALPTPGAAADDALRARLEQATLGDYDVLREVGRGGMAVVYLAWDRELARHAAIKVLRPELTGDPTMSRRFLQEARTAANLDDHPSVVRVYRAKEAHGLRYFVMKYVDGCSLEQLLRATGPLPADLAAHVVDQVARALQYAHARGVVHRDVKPANVLLDREGGVAVTDFGIAKVADVDPLTRAGFGFGTPHYMSPEQWRAEPMTAASDQYALGVVAYQAVAGAVPFDGTHYEVQERHLRAEPPALAPRRPDVPAAFAAAVARMLAKRPGDRFADLRAVSAALAAVPRDAPDVLRERLSRLVLEAAAPAPLRSAGNGSTAGDGPPRDLPAAVPGGASRGDRSGVDSVLAAHTVRLPRAGVPAGDDAGPAAVVASLPVDDSPVVDSPADDPPVDLVDAGRAERAAVESVESEYVESTPSAAAPGTGPVAGDRRRARRARALAAAGVAATIVGVVFAARGRDERSPLPAPAASARATANVPPPTAGAPTAGVPAALRVVGAPADGTLRLAVRDSVRLVAFVTDAGGVALPNLVVHWRSDDPTRLGLRDGWAFGLAPGGPVVVTATAGAARASLRVTVAPAGAAPARRAGPRATAPARRAAPRPSDAEVGAAVRQLVASVAARDVGALGRRLAPRAADGTPARDFLVWLRSARDLTVSARPTRGAVSAQGRAARVAVRIPLRWRVGVGGVTWPVRREAVFWLTLAPDGARWRGRGVTLAGQFPP